MATVKGNQKIAKRRGEKWRKKLIQGKKDAQVSPTTLKIMRATKGISQKELAKMLDVSLATYGGIERRKRTIREHDASKLAQALKTSVTKLFKEAAKERLIAV